MKNNFKHECKNKHNGIHNLGTSDFTCIYCINISALMVYPLQYGYLCRDVVVIFIVLKRVLKNVTKWFDSNPHIILTKYITDHQEHTNNDTDEERYKLINQGVKTTNNQYYITHIKN